MCKLRNKIVPLSLVATLLLSLLTGCTDIQDRPNQVQSNSSFAQAESSNPPEGDSGDYQQGSSFDSSGEFDISQVPDYNGEWYVVVNDNVPFFTSDELSVAESYESYSPLDSLGRCGTAEACIGVDIMPTEERESISEVKPSGWVNNPYDFIDGGYLYNRCHLIGFQLTGENANEENLITGTRSMNTDGMLPFENMVADYVKETENHVLYRVTPIFEGDNLVASGVLMEASSIEDSAAGIQFCVYCYNVEPGVCIDYATGNNWEDTNTSSVPQEDDSDSSYATSERDAQEYVLNTNSMKFHYPDCTGAEKISGNNREDVNTTREELISEGYSPCGICKP